MQDTSDDGMAAWSGQSPTLAGSDLSAADQPNFEQLRQTNLALKRTLHALAEEKLAVEIRAQKLARANDALQSVIDAMPDIHHMDELVPIALRIVALAFGSPDCSYYEHSEGCPIQVRYWYHDGRILLPSQLHEAFADHDGVLQQLADGFFVPDDYLGAHYRRRTRAALIRHDQGTSVDRFDAFAMANGWGPELNVPVVDNGKADATMVILRPLGATFSEDEIELAETLAKQLSLAMQTGRLAVRERQTALAYEQAARLARTNAALKRTTEQLVDYAELDQFMCTLLEEAVSAAGAVGGVFHLYWPERQELERRAVVQRGVSIKPQTDPAGAHLKAPISTRDNRIWEALNARRELSWHDSHDPLRANEPRTRLNLSLGHRHVATIPMVSGSDLIGFIAIAFDQSVASQPPDSVLDVAQVLAQQATLAVRLTRLSDAAREAEVSRIRELTAIEGRLRDTEVRAAVDAERARMAREIHDSMAQSFGSIAMQSDALLATGGEDARTRRTLERIMQTARAGMAEARATALALMPQENRVGAIDEALRDLADRSTITDRLLCQVESSGMARTLPLAAQDTLLRIAQEAINNAIRHANATRIDLHLRYADQAVQLAISDNGIGIADLSKGGSGMGLKGMRHRADALGGSFVLAKPEHGGTRLEVRIPLDGQL